MFKRSMTLLLVLFLVLGLAACSSGSKESRPQDYNGGGEPAPEAPDTGPGEVTQRKVIYEGSLSVTVAELDKAVQELNAKAEALGGFIASSSRNNSQDSPSARTTFRIPQARYQDFLAFARGLGEPGNEWIDSTDVTEEFVDLDARLANRRAHEERLLDMLTMATKVEELLTVERELARVREDIEVIEGRLRFFGEKVDLATITISLSQSPGSTEVPGIKPVGLSETMRRALKAISRSVTLFLDLLSYLVIALAGLLPFAIPALAALWLLVHLSRKRSKKHQA